ncbi:RNA-directed DNA polymerase, partial [Candidatus Magnetomorum sp. HK-1]
KLLNLIEKLIRNTPSGQGLPIGNLTSQFFANVYLDGFDHAVKEQWRIKKYIRYMDDFVIFGNSKEELKDTQKNVGQYLFKNLKMILHPSTCIHRNNHGLNFLGMRIFPNHIRVKLENRRRSIRKIIKKIQDYKNNEIDDLVLQQSIESIVTHLKFFCPHNPVWVPEP